MEIGGRAIASGGPRQITLAILLAGMLGLSACASSAHLVNETVHDEDLTYDDYDGTVSYDAADGDDLAYPPVEVHEFDPEAAEAAGAHQVIDGDDWLNADDHERNDMLNKVEQSVPFGSTIVLVVATGEVWVIPPDKFEQASQVIEPWWDEDYDELDEYVGEGYAGNTLIQYTPSGTASANAQVLTRHDYENLISYERGPTVKITAEIAPEVVFLHDFDPSALKYTLGADSVRVMTYNAWSLESPKLRGLELQSIAHYLDQTPAYKAPERHVAFAVTAPWGNVFAVPQSQLDHLVSAGEVKKWTVGEYYMLPSVPPTPNHVGRGENFQVTTKFNF